MYSQRKITFNDIVPEVKEAANPVRETNIHYGQIVERVVRSCPKSISDIARALGVSRRTLYNWFETKRLGTDIIYKIGIAIDHDFANDFAAEAEMKTKLLNFNQIADLQRTAEMPNNPIQYWMERYIKLLEQYNERLISAK